MSDIESRLRGVLETIADAAARAGRDARSVELLAVSKTRPLEDVLAAFAAGQRRFGENQLQDAQQKLDGTRTLPVEWHFIGPLQSNKTRPVAEQFAWIHSIDRLKVARRLSAQRPDSLPDMQCCLEYNVSGEQSKAGFKAGELSAAAAEIASLPRLRLRGLMAIPAPSTDPQAQRAAFRRVREAYEALQTEGHELDTLSMGMTDDMESAIAEGATMVRIGTAIFGPRLK